MTKEITNTSIKKLMRKAIKELRASNYRSAIDITVDVIEREKDHAGAHAIQFSALFKSERFEQARRMGSAAASLNPTSMFILNNQACLQLEAKQPAAASGLLKSLIKQYGEKAQWLYNLALAQRLAGNYDYAITKFARTLDLDQNHDRAAFQLAECLTIIGDQEQASRSFGYVRLLRSKHAPSHSNLIHHATIANSLSKQDLELEFALWFNRFVPTDKRYETHAISNPKTLNIGFLIGRLPNSWLHKQVAPLINALAQGPDKLTVYWHEETLDKELFVDGVTVVRSESFSDADFARQVRADKQDVLIDVCGMRMGMRQRTLALQMASKQFGWLAHEGLYATPLVEILDSRLNLYAVELTEASNTKPLPPKTFSGLGCENGVSLKVLKTWASILHKMPDWKLQLTSDDRIINKHLKDRLMETGIESARLEFGTNFSLDSDSIALDNFNENHPYSTITALQQGSTIIGLKGDHFPAQHTVNILKQCGRADWLCQNVIEYESKAIQLAQSGQRYGLTKNEFKASNLDNIEQFASKFREEIELSLKATPD